jgi:hypothetical protein
VKQCMKYGLVQIWERILLLCSEGRRNDPTCCINNFFNQPAEGCIILAI